MSEKEDEKTLGLDVASNQASVPVDTDTMFNQQHSPVYIVTILGTCVMYLILLVFNYLSSIPDGVIFQNTIGNMSDYYYFEVTPAGWAFSIWGLIYTYQFIWLIYSITTLFRSTPHSKLYLVPTIPLSAYLLYISNNIAVIAWLITFDRKIIWASMAALIYTPASLIAALVVSFWKQSQRIRVFNTADQRYESILLNALAHNAWAVYLGWTICAALLNFGFVLIYRLGLSQETAGTVVLSVLLVIIVVGCSLELTIFDRFLRYVVMHYVGPLVALIGSIYRQSMPNETTDHISSGKNRTLAIAILCVGVFFTLVKLFMLFLRAWKQPLYYVSKVEEDETKQVVQIMP